MAVDTNKNWKEGEAVLENQEEKTSLTFENSPKLGSESGTRGIKDLLCQN